MKAPKFRAPTRDPLKPKPLLPSTHTDTLPLPPLPPPPPPLTSPTHPHPHPPHPTPLHSQTLKLVNLENLETLKTVKTVRTVKTLNILQHPEIRAGMLGFNRGFTPSLLPSSPPLRPPHPLQTSLFLKSSLFPLRVSRVHIFQCVPCVSPGCVRSVSGGFQFREVGRGPTFLVFWALSCGFLVESCSSGRIGTPRMRVWGFFGAGVVGLDAHFVGARAFKDRHHSMKKTIGEGQEVQAHWAHAHLATNKTQQQKPVKQNIKIHRRRTQKTNT